MTPTIGEIAAHAAAQSGIGLFEIVGPSKVPRFTVPRQRAYALARVVTGKSLTVIGEAFGGRHHTTIMHGIRMDEARRAGNVEAEREFAREVLMLRHGRRAAE